MSLIEVRSVTKQYWLGQTPVHALRGIDLNVEFGEFLAIAGPSGSGKTTLLNLVGCIETPTTGSVRIEDADIAELSSDGRAALRARNIGFIFQHFNLLPVLTALENIEYPLLASCLSDREKRERAQRALDSVGLTTVAQHKPSELSGGQQQRVAIARAIVAEPRIVLADEPTANLDRTTGQDILSLMKRLNQQHGTTFMFSTHDPKVLEMANRIVTLSDGRIAPTP